MKLPIKFRGLAYGDMSGKKFKTPKMVYGNLITTESGDYAQIIPFRKPGVVTETYLVKPESIARLIGYDEDDNEVYDDDDMIDDGGYLASVLYALAKNDFEEKLAGFWLKESGNND